MNHKQLTQAERDFWGGLAISQEPEFWLSATFVRPYSDEDSIKALKFAMRAIQRRVPSLRPLRGIATIERTWKNASFEGCLHMHALLWGVVDNVGEPEAFMKKVVGAAFGRLKDRERRSMTNPGTINLQRIYEPEGVTRYMTKDLGMSFTRSSRVWLITPTGFDTTTENIK